MSATPGVDEGRGPSRRVIGAAVVLLVMIWGSTWLAIKGGLADLPPLTSAGIRFLMAAPLMFVLALVLHRREGGSPPGWKLTLASGSTNFALSYGIIYICEVTLPSGLVAVLWSVYPLMMAVISHLFIPGDTLTRRQGFGFVVGFTGVVFLFLTDVRRIGDGAVGLAALLLLSPLATAVGHAFIKRAGPGVSSLLLNRNGMIVGSILLTSSALIFERGEPVRFTTAAVTSLVYLALVGTVVAFSLYFWLLRYVRASRLGLMAFVIPMVAMFLGVAFGGETLRSETLVGTALIVTGVAMALRPARRAGGVTVSRAR